ncbi:hypothetical protein OPW41_00115 [Vibrio europaeus]|uniref:hypothetical protein n=1 Tax=Vibrio europaeus TaxID=300876 RepID=UPI00233F2B61|nr:hypothetical protein [Vibrio europaeus]MDC5758018.1 hypothetical protein [Vibrio europaeus]MDC5773588.1 hypothetical protein [Vibrio europaeus]MDC5793224.1 hypothetical protein [Vibrio europaeus]MDC5802711.1 hypothetical protein [Vibrio europaeus]MDC5814645.1 hypothetical protein [Vibrio europaeus]
MPSKNPIKGYIACPTQGCGEVCTVHAVGEYRLMQGGEVPKNKRRLGQLYTICPNCKTNQSAGKPFQEWLQSGMKPTKEAALTVSKAVTPSSSDSVTVTKPDETSVDAVSDENEVTEKKPKVTVYPTVLKLFAILSGCALLYALLTTKKDKEPRDGNAPKRTRVHTS